MSDNQLSTNVKPRASHALSVLTGMEPAMMLDTIKAQCFKGDPSRVSDTQLAAFVSIAAEMGVNPLLPGMMYAYPTSGGGITPMMGPDAVYKKLSEHANVDSWKTTVYPEDVSLPPTHATTEIFLRNSERSLSYTAILSEWKVSANPNWGSRPRHMLALRSLKQCARQVIHGVPFDEDERQIMDAVNVTGTAETAVVPDRPAPKPRSPKGAALVRENPKPVEVVIPAETVQAPANATEPAAVNPLHADGEKIIAGANAKVEAAKVAQTPAAAVAAGEFKDPDMKRLAALVAAQSAPVAPKPASAARSALNAGEVITVEAQVDEFSEHPGIKDGKEIKYVKARITSPEYVGEVSDLSRSPLWTLDDGLRLTLRGNGKRVFVDKVANITEAAPDTATAVDEF